MPQSSIRPDVINILGVNYQILYVDKPSEVDAFKRESLWGQVDYWTRTIRIYDNGRSDEDVWQTILHEVLHAIADGLKLKVLGNRKNHDELDVVALALTDIIFRNQWFSIKGRSEGQLPNPSTWGEVSN